MVLMVEITVHKYASNLKEGEVVKTNEDGHIVYYVVDTIPVHPAAETDLDEDDPRFPHYQVNTSRVVFWVSPCYWDSDKDEWVADTENSREWYLPSHAYIITVL